MAELRVLTKRNTWEILRDPISVIFGLAFPVVLLLLLSLINRSIPKEAEMNLFEVATLTPGVAVFGLSFLALFIALLVSKDRESSFLMRLYTTPLKSSHFILSYLLPMLPMAALQLLFTYAIALLLGLDCSPRILVACLVSLPIAVVHISIGLICGTLFREKAVGGVCGALLTNVSAWLSGTWFSLEMIGGAFEKIAYWLPFANAVDAARCALLGDLNGLWQHLWIVLLWAGALLCISVWLFARKMKQK